MSFSSNLWPNSNEDACKADANTNDKPTNGKSAIRSNGNIAVYLKGMDPHSTEQAIKNLCSTWGKVSNVKKFSATSGMVWYYSFSDAEIAIRKLNEGNDLMIEASLGQKQNGTDKTNKVPDAVPPAVSSTVSSNNNSDGRPYLESEKSNIVWSNRTIKGPFNRPNVIKLDDRYVPVTGDDYQTNPNLRKTDPNMDFCDNDEPRHTVQPGRNSDYGKLKFKSPPQFEQNMLQMARSSGGHHSESPNEGLPSVEVCDQGPCNVCRSITDKQCERCGDFYCSFVCQRNDWKEHRFICMPMPKLVSSKNRQNQEPMPIRVASASHVANGNGAVDSARKPNGYPIAVKPQNGKNSGSNVSQAGSQSSSNDEPLMSKTSKNPRRQHKSKPLQSSETSSSTQSDTANTSIFPPPKSNARVIITYVINHRKVFLRSAEPDAHQDYLRTLMDCAEFEKSSKNLVHIPKMGDIMLAKFDGVFYRALVLNVKLPDEITVAFIDFGNKGEVALGDMRTLSAELRNRPRHTFLVTLDGLQEQMHNKEVMFELTDLMDASTPVRLVYDDKTPIQRSSLVKLYDLATNKCINEMLTERNNIQAVPISDPPLQLSDLEIAPLDGVDIDVVVLDNSLLSMNTLYCVRKDHLAELYENNELFQEYCNRVKEPYTPRMNELCLVFCEVECFWYRAVCLELAGDGMPTVQCIDYGNNSVISIKNIRKMPKQFAYRRVSVDCTLVGIGEVTHDMLDVLTGMFQRDSTVRIDKAETMKLDNEEISTLRSDKLIRVLREKNLLV